MKTDKEKYHELAAKRYKLLVKASATKSNKKIYLKIRELDKQIHPLLAKLSAVGGP